MNDAPTQARGHDGFIIGLLVGSFVGAGLAMWLAPRTVEEFRQRMNESTARLRRRASGTYQQASTGVRETVAELARKGRAARDGVADAVARGAHEVERSAASVKGESPVRAD
jgi:gas vesicle protein